MYRATTKAKGCPVMTSESKILTVSYGTFSCTLEGFENPFDTMKAIAEYFRDLAAQDRHFGAEPPPPDAAMLHRLAEREVARLADAATARDTGPKAEALVDAPPAEPAVSPRIQFNVAPERRRSRLTQDGGAPVEDDAAAAEPSLKDDIPEGVAAKLARIRRSVPSAAAELTNAPSDAIAGDIAAADNQVLASPAVPDETHTWSEASETDLEPTVQAFDPFDTSLAEAAADEIPDIPDVASRLGAMVADGTEAARPITSFADAYDPFGDTELYADPQGEAAVDPADLADLAALDGDTPAEIAPEATTFTALADDLLPEDLDPVADIEPANAIALTTEDPLPEDAPALYDVQPDAEFAFAHHDAADPTPAEVVDLGRPDASPAAPTEAPAEPVAEVTASDAKATRRSRRLNSRVVRLHPDEEGSAADPSVLRSQAQESESDQIARLMQQAEEVMAEETNKRRQEALSRLKAAVASTEADRADLDYEAPRGDTNLDPYRDDLAEAIQPDEAEAPPAPPEVKPTRRKSVNIRPQEPRPGTIRPGMISPPPLVLVSEQRIDRVAPVVAPAPAAPAPSLAPAAPGIAPANPAGQPMVALRTGRLSGAIGAGAAVAASAAPARGIVLEKPSYGTAAEAAEDEDLAEDSAEIDDAGLAAFAETVGARSMAELLEAAAAYATCVEKRAQFTRPQLMRRMVASAGGKPVSREDGLRSFGTLLRTGRIEKVTRGHYSLAETSPYLAEARRLG
jgi:hypothetical protein